MPSCPGNWEKESESADVSGNVEEIVFADQPDPCDAELPRSVRMLFIVMFNFLWTQVYFLLTAKIDAITEFTIASY